MYGIYVTLSYLVFLPLVPALAHCALFRHEFLPLVSHWFSLSKVPLDPLLLAVSLVSVYVYFFLNLVLDVVQSIRTFCLQCEQDKTTTSNSSRRTQESTSSCVSKTCKISARVTRAYQQAVHYYPGFIASTLLVWANTNRFDTFSTAFVIIQVFFLLMLPLTYGCPDTMISHINRIGYQCALFWTLIYAMFPRDIGFLMDLAAYQIHQLCTPTPTDIYYTPIL
ncbi:uncharacterized protein BX664DRAFT_336632 [Halteromyces radiatus]|uniref:uncharacterized protein n=1 Tax=Halteromyces radiatus TaxID=101107 RepID=UPI00221E9F93|nr:uncharacterized protein BX664DRAFT_336632 [Halteromyces radiatus]KAI8086732.1 hypothetical protein BX664DRAFT_336632 [Halteromyces radiatus]